MFLPAMSGEQNTKVPAAVRRWTYAHLRANEQHVGKHFSEKTDYNKWTLRISTSLRADTDADKDGGAGSDDEIRGGNQE